MGTGALLQPIRNLRAVGRFRAPELSRRKRVLRRCADVEDLRLAARRHLPAGVFDYLDGGAEAEVTLRRNVEAFQALTWRPRVLRDVGRVDPSTTVLGRPLPLPLLLAPTGFNRVADPAGELAVARSAARAGLPYTLSTLSTRSIEEVAGVSDGERWFQVYVWRDRGLLRDMLQRARAAGYSAIVVTVDTAVLGRRERDVRHGFTLPPQIGVSTLLDGVRHPAWTWGLLRHDPLAFANLSVAPGAVELAPYMNSQFDPSLSWHDLDWIRSEWGGPVVLKGIQSVEDAVLAADAGIEAIALSNHGGRQLDGAPAPIDLVAPVVDAVGGRTEVLCDGGVRRGSDVVKAVALGARACMIGRPYLYALAAAGEAGVDHVLGLFDAGVRRTMSLVGCRDIAQLGPHLLAPPTG